MVSLGLEKSQGRIALIALVERAEVRSGPRNRSESIYAAWTDRPRVAATARKIKTFRMGRATVKWITRGILT
jgi:hypothetical protein